MENLEKDWFAKGLIDFEYKKYILLDYLSKVSNRFAQTQLYPFLADLIFHYKNLEGVRKSGAALREAFPKEISKADFVTLKLKYRQLIEDDAVMAEIESIIDYAIPVIQQSLEDGTEIFDFVESQCEIVPIGVTPLYRKEGYLFITQPPESVTQLYRFKFSLIHSNDQMNQGLETEHIEEIQKSGFLTYENIKINLIKKYQDLPNPAAYLIHSKMKFPLTATLVPVAKRLFIRHLSAA